MDRIKLIQEIFRKSDFSNYLEIGCNKGKSFFPIRAKHKVAVDPNFLIPIKRRIFWAIRWPSNLKNHYFEETSDEFFANRREFLVQFGKLDVVLVDGLHTFRAALSDVLHSLKYLNPKGLILMHDCYPPEEAAAFPSESFPTLEEQKTIVGWTGSWCGDVWKSIVYLLRVFPDTLEVGVIDTDFGLGYVMAKPGFANGDFEIDEEVFAELDKLDYLDMMKDPESVINLKNVGFAFEIVARIVHGSK